MAHETSRLAHLLDRTEIIDCVVRFANAFDMQDWGRLRGCLADDLETDYSQLRGTPPGRQSADSYVAARTEGLRGLRTLHISSNHEVTIEGDRARCWSAYRIYRLDPERPPGEGRLDTAGNYEHGLVRAAPGWRIHHIRQTVVVRDGNPEVHPAARPRVP